MEIQVRPHPNFKDRWEIFLDDEKWREVHRSIFGKNFSLPETFEDKNWEVFFESLEYKRVRGYVLWRLSSQNYHSEQLAKLLRERLVSPCLINQIIFEFCSKGFLDDELWLKNFIKNRQKNESLKTILAKLYAKGLSKESLDQISQRWKDPKKELEAIEKLLKGRYRSKDLTQFKEKAKVVGSLLRKGFSYDLIQIGFQRLGISVEFKNENL